MAINYIFSGNPENGTNFDDIILGHGYVAGPSTTINGNDGDDLIIADIGYLSLLQASLSNNSIANAYTSFENGFQFTTDEDQLVANSAIPHATAIVEATAGETEFFSVAVGAGETLTADIDFGSNSAIGTNVDTYVVVRDGSGTIVASSDDSFVTDGGAGSTSTLDSYLTYTPASAGTYYIEVRKYISGGGGTTFTGGETFLLNVSVTGHTTYSATPTGGDTITGGAGNDTIYGVAGDDTIIWAAGDGSDTINGGSGSDLLDLTGSTSGWTVDLRAGTASNTVGDTLSLALVERVDGTNFADSLRSYGGGSVINALGGNDIVYAVNGVPETLDGGSGVDTIDTTDFSSAGAAYTINMVTGATNAGESYTNFENLVSGGTDDTITGTIAANVITTNDGYDVVYAGDGADKVYGGNGGGYLYGNEANDKLYGGTGTDYLDGGTGVDVMTGGDSSDVYFVDVATDRAIETSTGGFDYVYSTAATYTLNNNVEELILSGTAAINGKGNSGDNYLYGNNNANVLSGNDGTDYIVGYDGNDTLNGGRGADSMYGGVGDDSYNVDDAGDVVTEYSGEGTADRVVASINYTLTAEVENLVMTGVSRIGTGNNLGNTIVGSDGNDTISGLDGIDKLQGGLGNDTISGGNDNDTITGGLGRDTMTGDGGVDRFVFGEGETGNTNATADRITDFTHGVDRIVLNTIDANANTGPANEAFSFIGTAAFSHTAGELRYMTSGGDTYVQGDTNGDGTADLVIRLTNTIPLTAVDFVL